MANQVYANGREVSCKAADGKSICAFPDVCLSPPSPPAGPIPIPYPNTGFASDMTEGSKTVKISDKEVMLKDKSYFKKSTGDEAATKSLGMGVVTHQIQGKVYFTSWSMDVKFEGENVVRHLDLTTHNHGSCPGDTPTWPYVDRMALAGSSAACQAERGELDSKCKDKNGNVTGNQCLDFSKVQQAIDLPKGTPDKRKALRQAWREFSFECEKEPLKSCMRAARCFLLPYEPSKCCKPGQSGHHLVPKSQFVSVPGCENYNPDKAPCICLEGYSYHQGSHGVFHRRQKRVMKKTVGSAKHWKLSDAMKNAARVVHEMYPHCSEACIESQLRKGHRDAGIPQNKNPDIKAKDVSSDKDPIHPIQLKFRK